MDKICVAFVCNQAYFDKFMYTLHLLTTVGNYKGDILLIIGDDLKNSLYLYHKLLFDNKVIIKHFPDFNYPDCYTIVAKNLNRCKSLYEKRFQNHKLYLFDTFLKNWDYIFYIDCGMTIFSDINPILNCRKKGKLLAHSDSYPTYQWTLGNQFDKESPFYKKLESDYKLDIDYPQTGILLYDTNIIEKTTFPELYNLLITFPNVITNDQGIIALYFTNIKPVFRQIPLKGEQEDQYYYDCLSRNKHHKYIMLKI
jgi:hypothetical protein